MKNLLIATLILMACTSEDRAKTTLESAGYSKIVFTGYGPLACRDEDAFSTKFIANNPVGNRVSGIVCCGLVEACTIRF